MNHDDALQELRRQLSTGKATREQYTWAINKAESEMIDMHTVGCYDVLGYAQWEATANVYREVLGLPPCDITQRSDVSPTLSDQEYHSAMVAQLPERQSAKRSNGGGQLWEPCPRCGDEPVHLNCGYCDRHCQC